MQIWESDNGTRPPLPLPFPKFVCCCDAEHKAVHGWISSRTMASVPAELNISHQLCWELPSIHQGLQWAQRVAGMSADGEEMK